MTNAFEKHNIEHLSASTLNLFVLEPAYCLLKLSGFQMDAGPAAWRGKGVDRAATLAAFDKTKTVDELLEVASSVFDEEDKESQSQQNQEKVTKEKKNLTRYVEVATRFYRGLDQSPIDEQQKIECNIDGIEVPYVGFYDLLYPDSVRDIKTVGAMPSKLSEAHARQVSMYGMATERQPWIDYIGVKEARPIKIDRVEYWVKQTETIANTLKNVLSLSDDFAECCQLFYPNFDHWIWSENTKAAATKIWRI